MTLTLVLTERERAEIHRRADAVSAPDHSDYGQHLQRSELSRLVLLDPTERQAVVDWVTSHGMEVVDAPGVTGQLLFVRATEEQVRASFGDDLPHWIQKDPENRGARIELAVPRRLAGYIQKVGGLPGEQGQITLEAPLDEALASDFLSPEPPTDVGALTPSDIRNLYSFPDEYDGAGETIALMMLGGRPDPDDLHGFWTAYGIRPPDVRVVRVGRHSDRPPNPLHTLEATMSVQWVGALAPGASIVVYALDPTVMGDPWSAFLLQLLGDETHAPTVASTSWVTPERQYYRLHGHHLITGLLDQAALLGITVIAAAGDWGTLDGTPRAVHDGRPVCDAAWPHGTFPAVEERILAVGGTMLTHRQPLTEVGWSGPPPAEVRSGFPFEQMATGGGFSTDVPIPAWQKPVLRSYYSRGTETAAVVPGGRGFPDVAMLACGPTLQLAPGQPLTSVGFRTLCGGQWFDFAGGTSVSAPLWATAIAILNQARRAVGRSRLGFANPFLYRLRNSQPPPFRPITQGHNDVVVNVVGRDGRAVTQRVPGFECRPGWSPVTGLGVPNLSNLVRHVTQ